jgi:hypothetical protein
VFRPALLPDNKRLVWYPLAICGVLVIAGCIMGNLALVVIPLLVVGVFPGIPIAIHSVYFFSVKITLEGDLLTVADWAGDPFVSYPRRQEIALSHVAHVYHLQREAEAYQGEGAPSAPFGSTRIRMNKYRRADADARRVGAVARTDNGLVLSSADGTEKVYLMHFHDLSKKNWQALARLLQQANPSILFEMTEHERKGLLGRSG